MITWGKGMGGDVPMAGLSIRKDLAEQIEDHSQPNTFAGNAMLSAACMANIDILMEDDQALVKRAGTLGKAIKEQINAGAKDIEIIGDVRGNGLMIGIEMVENRETKEPLSGDKVGQIIMGLLEKGLVMVPCGRYGNVFRFMPPLTLTKAHASKAVEILLETAASI